MRKGANVDMHKEKKSKQAMTETKNMHTKNKSINKAKQRTEERKENRTWKYIPFHKDASNIYVYLYTTVIPNIYMHALL